MYLFEKGPIRYLQSKLLCRYPEIQHACILKGAFPISFHSEELHNSLLHIENIFGFKQFIYAHQVHSDVIKICENSTQNYTPIDACDGLITVQKGCSLVIRHADCQVAIFYDPYTQVIANVHAGWRGLVKNIYKKCVDELCKGFQCEAKHIRVAIFPSLGPMHAEFIHYEQEFPHTLWHFQDRQKRFNLWEIGRWQLQQAGILSEHIENASICTYASKELCYSYRRDQTMFRHATIVQLVANE